MESGTADGGHFFLEARLQLGAIDVSVLVHLRADGAIVSQHQRIAGSHQLFGGLLQQRKDIAAVDRLQQRLAQHALRVGAEQHRHPLPVGKVISAVVSVAKVLRVGGLLLAISKRHRVTAVRVGLNHLANGILAALCQGGDDRVKIATPQLALAHGLRDDALRAVKIVGRLRHRQGREKSQNAKHNARAFQHGLLPQIYSYDEP